MVNLKNLIIVTTAFFSCTLSAPATVQSGDIIPDSYIVTLKPTVTTSDAKLHIEWVNDVHRRSLDKRGSTNGVKRTYDNKSGYQGYAGSFSKSTIDKIKNNNEVVSVEADRIWKLTLVTKPQKWPSSKHVKGIKKPVPEVRDMINQTTATWGLGTVSQRAKGYSYYLYDSLAGSNTYAYVVDTGVRITHSEFEGRATTAYTAFPGKWDDTQGHGTHVAGIIAGKTYGVAKNAQIVGVKVFDGSGTTTTSVVMGGIDWAINDIIGHSRTASAVINLSISGGKSSSLNKLIDTAFKSGVITVVAAGNSGATAQNYSPASALRAITVGAIDSNWNMASFSNFGSNVKIFAPGVGVVSAWLDSDTATAMLDGTSMACPHVAGLVLYGFSVNQIASAGILTWLQKTSTAKRIVGGVRGSANLIGNNGNTLQKQPVGRSGQA
ncbi:Fc.00g096890.m01.CDS01 [Cosmosporella sp. VM-42]